MSEGYTLNRVGKTTPVLIVACLLHLKVHCATDW